MEFLKRSSAGPAQPTRPIVEASNATEAPSSCCPSAKFLRTVFPPPKVKTRLTRQNRAQSSRSRSIIVRDADPHLPCCATTRLPVGAVDDERCRRHWV